MSQSKFTELTLTEQPVIEWFKELGYSHAFGPDISPGGNFPERDSFREVVLAKRLLRTLRKLNPKVPDSAINEAISQILKLEYPSIDIANMTMHRILVEGVKVKIRDESEQVKGEIIRVFDFENPANNEFLVVNQFAIQGLETVRRPDVVVFVNGIPVAIFELKSPTSEEGTIRSAYKQLTQLYKKDISDIFKYNQILVVSDLLEARHGTLTSPWEWFAIWKGIESEDNIEETTSQLETLVKGIFHKVRLMDILENFIVFESDGDKVSKKMCLYHQYFGVNKAVKETSRATDASGNRKIGVFWHTQGSGKSLSMVFYVNKTKKLSSLANPTYVFLTDRNDLDNQLCKVFLRSGYPFAKQADSIADLKEKLTTPVGDLIFTTIQKFETDIGGKYPLISQRSNIIVIADEAHRSQYAKLAGNVRFALPNASFMGITGTPISLNDRDTRLVFGDYISSYKINQAVNDGAIVTIFYEGRLVPLHLTNQFIDEEYDDLMAEQEFEIRESLKKKWARLEQAVGAQDRLKQIAQDIIAHFNGRGFEGKAMVVTISRRVAVEMYELMTKISGAPEMAVVISKLEEFKDRAQDELQVKEIERRFKDPDDPLKMVVVCDMWLTGFDVPPLHTMYIDKPLKNHTLMQAIARVNRVFKDKNGGLIVDYIGIADNLRKSLSIYSSDVQHEALIPIEEAIRKMQEKYDVVKTFFHGLDYSNWKKLSPVELAQLFQKAVNMVLTDEKTGNLDEAKQERFLKESRHLFMLFALVSPHKEANEIRSDIEFFRSIQRYVVKRTVITLIDVEERIDSAVRELVSKSIAAEGVVDIFAMQGKGKPDISIFDDRFIEEVKKMQYKNFAIQILRKLLNDEIKVRMRKNVVRYKSLLEMLERIIEEYENNIINSTKVIERLLELAREIKNAEAAGQVMGLSEEELAFYDVVSKGKEYINDDEKLKGIVKDLVKGVKRDLAVDWTNNEVIKARIRANVKRILLVNDFPPEASEDISDIVYQQAFSLYRDYAPVFISG